MQTLRELTRDGRGQIAALADQSIRRINAATAQRGTELNQR
jgi:hypothetical protein